MKLAKARNICIFVWLFVSSVLNAQPPSYKTYNLPREGTPAEINCLYQDKRGYIMIGATTGLYLFDGQSFRKLVHKGNNAANVTAICETQEGVVWIGFADGKLGLIKNQQVVLQDPEEGLPTKRINKIIESPTGMIWIATAGEGVYYYKDKRFYNINIDDGLTDNYVYDLETDKNGIIAATDRGLNFCTVNGKGKQIRALTSARSGLPDNIVRSLAKKNSQLFFGMHDAGIGGIINNAITYTKSWNKGPVNDIIVTDYSFWIATENGLLNGDVANHPTSIYNTVIPGKISALLLDNGKNIWAAGKDQLYRTNGDKLRPFVQLNASDAKNLHTLLVDKEKHVWINGSTGLKHISKDEQGYLIEKIYSLPVSINSQITALHEDKFENIWIGTMGNGVFILDPKTGKYRKITENQLLSTASILSINGRNGNIWIASLEGAVNCQLLPANSNIQNIITFTDYADIKGIGTNYIYDIYVDKGNRAWFATDGKGISKFEDGKFTNYGKTQGLKSEVVYQITEDTEGKIWFTTLSHGVINFDGNQFTEYGLSKGLSDLNITSIASDNTGYIFTCHKNGIDVINSQTGTISYIDQEQGISELNTDLNTLKADVDGNIYFVTGNTIYKLIAHEEKLDPRVVIDKVQLFLKDINADGGHVFSSDENNISFYYTGLYYSQPAKIEYQYKLEGYNKEWITTNDRRRDFPQLSPGKYVFKVRASLNNNFSNATETIFPFTIQAPLWMRWWFIALVAMAVISLLYFYIKDREKRLQKWERLEKETIRSQLETLRSQVNPHFLFNSFNTLISEIEEDPKRAVEYTEHMADFFRSIVTYREKDLILLEEELKIIKDYLFIQQKRYGDAFKVEINIPGIEQNEYMLAPLTLQLLAENAIKHNSILKEKPLILEIFVEAGQLIVRNNINTKLIPEKSAGLGLQNIYRRYELLTKRAVIITNDNEHFTVVIPLISKTYGENTNSRR